LFSFIRHFSIPTSTQIDIMAEAQLNDFPSLFSLKGKVAVVTGGSRGLGLHAASALVTYFGTRFVERD
jgi:hypothetical protein